MDNEDSSVNVVFTSPYPVGHFTIPFGKVARERENVSGIKVFLFHGYVRNFVDSIDQSQWVPAAHFEREKSATKSDGEKKIFKEILDCL